MPRILAYCDVCCDNVWEFLGRRREIGFPNIAVCERFEPGMMLGVCCVVQVSLLDWPLNKNGGICVSWDVPGRSPCILMFEYFAINADEILSGTQSVRLGFMLSARAGPWSPNLPGHDIAMACLYPSMPGHDGGQGETAGKAHGVSQTRRVAPVSERFFGVHRDGSNT